MVIVIFARESGELTSRISSHVFLLLLQSFRAADAPPLVLVLLVILGLEDRLDAILLVPGSVRLRLHNRRIYIHAVGRVPLDIVQRTTRFLLPYDDNLAYVGVIGWINVDLEAPFRRHRGSVCAMPRIERVLELPLRLTTTQKGEL